MSPALYGVPLLGRILDSQVDELDGGVLGGEGSAVFGYFPQAHMQQFHGVGRIDDLADFFRKFEERDDPLPVPFPDVCNHLVLGIPRSTTSESISMRPQRRFTQRIIISSLGAAPTLLDFEPIWTPARILVPDNAGFGAKTT